MAGTIYILQQDHTKDFTPLLRYNKPVKYIFSRGVYQDDWQRRLPLMIREAERDLRDFDEAHDLIVLNGDFVLMCIVAQILGKKGQGFLVLKWDALEKDYYQVYIPSLLIEDRNDQ